MEDFRRGPEAGGRSGHVSVVAHAQWSAMPKGAKSAAVREEEWKGENDGKGERELWGGGCGAGGLGCVGLEA